MAYKAKVAKLVQATDDREDLPRAVNELEEVVGLLRSEDSEVSRLIRAIAHHLGLPPADVTLLWLADSLTGPWSQTLADHAVAYDRLLGELRSTLHDNRSLATSGAANLRLLIDEIIEVSTADAGTYDSSGEAVDVKPQAVDQLL